MKKIFEDFKIIMHDISHFTKEIYLTISLFISTALAHYTDIKTALFAFLIITLIDTTTRINADALKKGLKFNPFKKYFWLEIKSTGLRDMCKKIFSEYFMYLIIAFVVDVLIFKQEFLIEFMGRKLTLPVISLYIFSAVEIWSIAENIEDAGGVNLLKRVMHFLPEKWQLLFKPKSEE